LLISGLLNVITIALWMVIALYVMAMLYYYVPRQGIIAALQRLLSRSFLPLLLVGLAVSIVARSLVFIEPQEAAIVISLVAPDGYRDRPLRSGLHWIVPLVEDVRRYPIAWQTYTMSANPMEGQTVGNDTVIARTQDGQEVMIDCSLIYRIDADQVIRVHIDWQDRYVADFIRPIMRNLVRNLASQYTADEINSSQRVSLEADLNTRLQNELSDKGFVMDVFLIRNISFSPEYATAVEQKQVAQQSVLQSQYQATQVVILADADADAILRRAQAEAEALSLIAAQLENNPALLTYRYIDKLSPNISVMLVPNNAPLLLPLPTPQTLNTSDLLPDSAALATPTPNAVLAATPSPTPTQGG
jgi:regulator of protease activity HflC (stomatin/prohibitin superfamily)